MLRKLQALSPPFLKRLDHHLLIHYPALWATRIHQVIFFGSLAFGLLALKALFTPIKLQDVPDTETHFGLLMVPVALCAGLWAIRVYQFKPEKVFGERKAGQWMREQLIYILGILFMISGPIAYTVILNHKIDHKIDDQLFAQDVFVLDMGSEYYLNDSHYPQFGRFYLKREPSTFKLSHPDFSIPANSHEHTAQIQLFLDTYNRYSKEGFPHSPARVMDNFQHGESFFNSSFEKAKNSAMKNAMLISRIKTNKVFLYGPGSRSAFIAMVLFVCFAFSIFQQASWKQFLMALASAAIGGLIIGLASEFLDNTFRATRQEDWAMFIGIGLYGLLFTQIFRNRNTRILAQGRTVIVLLLALSFPVLLMCFIGWSNIVQFQDHKMTSVVLVTAAVSYFVWNGLYRLRLGRLQASPTRN